MYSRRLLLKYTISNFKEVKRSFIDDLIQTVTVETTAVSFELGPDEYQDSSKFIVHSRTGRSKESGSCWSHLITAVLDGRFLSCLNNM